MKEPYVSMKDQFSFFSKIIKSCIPVFVPFGEKCTKLRSIVQIFKNALTRSRLINVCNLLNKTSKLRKKHNKNSSMDLLQNSFFRWASGHKNLSEHILGRRIYNHTSYFIAVSCQYEHSHGLDKLLS